MKAKIASILRDIIHGESGQAIWWLTAGMFGFLGLGGLSVDVGRAYVGYDQLQASTNAAALAAAKYTFNSTGTTVSTQGSLYGSGSGGMNVNSNLGTVNTTATAVCVNVLLANKTGCSSGAGNNAVKVVQTSSVSTFFMRIFGINSVPLKATAMAAMQGVADSWNVAIILDATGSMSTTDSNCGGVTQFQCAMNGIKGLLSATDPCAPGYTSCATSHANFHVALFSFPGVSTSTVSNDSSSCSTPNYMQYTLPLTTATSYTPISYKQGSTTWTATYRIVDFSSDYYNAGALSTSSPLVKAVTGCMSPISAPGSGTGGLVSASSGGGITYYAGAIYAAQAALLAEQTANPGTKNALILLSDGQANVVSGTKDFPWQYSDTLGTGSSGIAASTGTGLYPDTKDECQQAIKAANDAAHAGTRVYSVAYGSQSSGCTGSGGTDSTLLSSSIYQAPLNVALTSISKITPCVTMEDIASSLTYFYSDYNQSGSGSTCQDSSHSVTSLQDIFYSIAGDFTKPQLLPNNAQ